MKPLKLIWEKTCSKSWAYCGRFKLSQAFILRSALSLLSETRFFRFLGSFGALGEGRFSSMVNSGCMLDAARCFAQGVCLCCETHSFQMLSQEILLTLGHLAWDSLVAPYLEGKRLWC